MVTVDKDVKLQGWERKSVLRKSVGLTLPKSITKAPKKGFGIPLREWFKCKSFDNHIRDNLREVSRVLDSKMISFLVKQNNDGKKDYGNFIWSLMMLNQFLD